MPSSLSLKAFFLTKIIMGDRINIKIFNKKTMPEFEKSHPEETPRENEEIEQMRQRVESLRETDNKYVDSVAELAKHEAIIREKLKKAGTTEEYINELANVYSTLELEKMEAEKEKWVDYLTGLRNKRAYNEEVPQLLNIESREDRDCSLVGY